jgi:hypothetical protein
MQHTDVQQSAGRGSRQGVCKKHLDVPRSGRWGDCVYYMRGKKQCCRRHVVPRDPRTPRQLRWRAALAAASQAWSNSRTLTEAEQQAWRSAGAKVRTRRRLGQGGTLTGQLYFVAKTCARAGVEGGGPAEGKAELTTQKASNCTPALDSRLAPELGARISASPCPARPGRGLCLSGRRRGARSTWDGYRLASVMLPSQCRRGEERRTEELAQGRRNGSAARGRWSGHWREGWRGG